eukprot:2749075-Amphidinium_carterae.2
MDHVGSPRLHAQLCTHLKESRHLPLVMSPRQVSPAIVVKRIQAYESKLGWDPHPRSRKTSPFFERIL